MSESDPNRQVDKPDSSWLPPHSAEDPDALLELARLREELGVIKQSVGYQLLEKVRGSARRIAPWGTLRGAIFLALLRALRILQTEGLTPLLRRLPRVGRWGPRLFDRPGPGPFGVPLNAQYSLWLRANAPSEEELIHMGELSRASARRPLVSIVMPVHNTPVRYLRAAVESVREQVYDRWQLCIADDCSQRADTLLYLDELRGDARISVTKLDRRLGIAGASNAALSEANGDFVALLDHDDTLTRDALFRIVEALNATPEALVLYSDEDKIDDAGVRSDPFFKPGWSPDLLTSMNYVAHLLVVQKPLLDQVGGFRLGFDGSQDHDLVLRLTEQTDAVVHVPKQLYSWRKALGSSATAAGAKSYAHEAGKRALADALERRGLRGEVLDGVAPGRYRVRYDIRSDYKVAIIIPTRNRIDLLRRCVESVTSLTTYSNHEIVVVDNDSDDRETLEYLRGAFPGRVIDHPEEFNYSAMMNRAANQVDADGLLFLNNDTQVISPEWLAAMVEHAQRDSVGAVGARLIYPSGQVQHEGVIVGLGGSAGNVDHGGYFDLGVSIRNCSAVTAACMLVPRDAFDKVGGFEERLGVAFNDVDLCLRMGQEGLSIIYTPYALLYHHEGATRGRLHPVADERFFRERWGEPGTFVDPFYNPNLSRQHPFSLNVTRPDPE